MRIISGSAGGLRLKVPKSGVRPTTDRAKAAMFSWIGERIGGARVLDLFAGAGGLGLEALSRGAREVVFVEAAAAAQRAIRDNLAHARLAGGSLVGRDAAAFLDGPAGPDGFDFIFADPPWAERGAGRDWVGWILAHPRLPAFLAPQGRFVLEAPSGRDLAGGPAWAEVDRRRYGTTSLWFWRKAEREEGA
jgi:16S rRNA (guanine966-N2)-methyltransferase